MPKATHDPPTASAPAVPPRPADRRHCRWPASPTGWRPGHRRGRRAVRLHSVLVAQGAAVARAEAECEGVPFPASREVERRLTEADERWSRILGTIIGTPARTQAGLRAKAAVTLLAQQKYNCVHTNSTVEDIVAGHEGDIEDRLALSIARDLLNWRA